MTARASLNGGARARPRDAGASRAALLDAARTLFGDQGFEGTTTREIGELAGVDPALIARYFGGKADLYIASLVAETQGDEPPARFEGVRDVAAAMIARTDAKGLGPAAQALIRSDAPPTIQLAAQAHIARRLVAPVHSDLARRGVVEPELHAEITVAALIGITLGRSLGWFEQLPSATTDRLVEVVTDLLDPLPPPAKSAFGPS